MTDEKKMALMLNQYRHIKARLPDALGSAQQQKLLDELLAIYSPATRTDAPLLSRCDPKNWSGDFCGDDISHNQLARQVNLCYNAPRA